MVSIFSFFSKKRPKSGSSSVEESTRRPVSPPSPKRLQRVRSTRSKPESSFKGDAARRASTDGLSHKRLKSHAAVSTPPPRINIALPSEAQASTFNASLGLDAVGRTLSLTAEERRALDAQRYTPADLCAAWEWIGTDLSSRGAETVGIMLPRRMLASKDRQRQLGALFAIARRPELASTFPSLSNLYPTVTADEAAAEWKSRLVSVARDTSNPVDLAEMLKTILRRLAPNARPIIDQATYIRFVQQEHAASYPRMSYQTMLVQQLSKEVADLLSAVFEVVSAIALHSEQNAMSAGRLCHLFGWWLLGVMPQGSASWNDLYQAYKLAGQRAEHLFYARIRWQTTQQKMPRRLVQLILSYPFGESSASSEHLPLPPASTYPRRALHVALGTDSAPPTGTDPAKVLGDALIAKLDDGVTAPEWQALRAASGGPVTLDAILSEDSQAFLAELSQAKGLERAVTPTDDAEDEAQYHPFVADGERITGNRRRSTSLGDLSRFEVAGAQGTHLSAVAESPTGSTGSRRSIVRLASAADLTPSKKVAAWADFEKSGFGDGDYSLNLTKPKTPHKDARLSVVPKRLFTSEQKPTTSYLIVAEEYVDVDDAFIHFVEDAQLDPSASSSWPRFALVQLRKPFEKESEPVEWLLVTVKKREHRRAPSIDEPLPDLRSPEYERPLSPSGESQMSRFGSAFGLRDLATTFRRRSMMANHTAPARVTRTLPPVTEYKPKHATRDSAASDAPTEYTIGEMGEIVKIPSQFELASKALPSQSQLASVDSVLSRTPASDWVYLAEGGAHVVFRYRGTDPSLQGRAIRLVKSTSTGAAEAALRQTWNERLLPQLLPVSLRVEVTPTPVGEQWTRGVVAPTELLRPVERRANGQPLTESIDYSRPAQLMDDLTSALPGTTVLAIEIKPKWGFLPSAEHITPLEAAAIKASNCRFCMHEHYRGHAIGEGSYCPLDLYSGNSPRVHKALDALWASWRASDGEKNNLRIFVDGKKVLPGNSQAIPGGTEGANGFVAPLLEHSAVFKHLKTLQSTLDATNISALAKAYMAANPGSEPFANSPEPSAEELSNFVTKYKSGSTDWTLREGEIAFGLSAIFKDCSVIVRAVLDKKDAGYILNEAKSSVKIIDTDLKPLASLPHWYQLDEKLWRHWAATKGVPEAQPEQEAPRETANEQYHDANTGKILAAGALGGATAGLAAKLASSPQRQTDSSSIVEVDAANSALARVVTPSPSKSLLPDQFVDQDQAPTPATSPDAAAPSTAVEPEQEDDSPTPISATARQVPSPLPISSAPVHLTSLASVLPSEDDVNEFGVATPSRASFNLPQVSAGQGAATAENGEEHLESTVVIPADANVEDAHVASEVPSDANTADVVPAPETENVSQEPSNLAELGANHAEAVPRAEDVTPEVPAPVPAQDVASSKEAVEATGTNDAERSVLEDSTPAHSSAPTAQPDADVFGVVAPTTAAASEAVQTEGEPENEPLEAVALIPTSPEDAAASGVASPVENSVMSEVPVPPSSTDKKAGVAALGSAAAATAVATSVGVSNKAATSVRASAPSTLPTRSAPKPDVFEPEAGKKKGRISSLFTRKTSGKGESTVPKPHTAARSPPLAPAKAQKDKPDKEEGSGFSLFGRKHRRSSAMATAGAATAAVAATAAAATTIAASSKKDGEETQPVAASVSPEAGVPATSDTAWQRPNFIAVPPLGELPHTPTKRRPVSPPLTPTTPIGLMHRSSTPATPDTSLPWGEKAAETPKTDEKEQAHVETESVKSPTPGYSPDSIDDLQGESTVVIDAAPWSHTPPSARRRVSDSHHDEGSVGDSADQERHGEGGQERGVKRLGSAFLSEHASPSRAQPLNVDTNVSTPERPIAATNAETPDTEAPTAIPRLSTFGNDLRSTDPEPLSPSSMVPTKALESPTDETLRKADTAFPRLSAFIDQERAAEIAAAANASQPEIQPLPEASDEGHSVETSAPALLSQHEDSATEEQASKALSVGSDGQNEPSNMSNFAVPAAVAALAGAAGTVAATSSDISDSDASSLHTINDRFKRSTAPSPSPHLSALSGEVEPFSADLAGVQEEVEHREHGGGVPDLDTPVQEHAAPMGNIVTEPIQAANDIPETTQLEPIPAVVKEQLHMTDSEVAHVEDVSSPTEATEVEYIERATTPDASRDASGPTHPTTSPSKIITLPSNVEHYKRAELPPLPPSASEGVLARAETPADADDITSSISSPVYATAQATPFHTAPVTPVTTAIDAEEKQDTPKPAPLQAVLEGAEMPDLPKHSPTPPMMHVGQFPRSVSGASGLSTFTTTSTETPSSPPRGEYPTSPSKEATPERRGVTHTTTPSNLSVSIPAFDAELLATSGTPSASASALSSATLPSFPQQSLATLTPRSERLAQLGHDHDEHKSAHLDDAPMA